jgi:hypothetical protein
MSEMNIIKNAKTYIGKRGYILRKIYKVITIMQYNFIKCYV